MSARALTVRDEDVEALLGSLDASGEGAKLTTTITLGLLTWSSVG